MSYKVDYVDIGLYYLRDEEYGNHLGRIELFREVTDKLNDDELEVLLADFLTALLKKLEQDDSPS